MKPPARSRRPGVEAKVAWAGIRHRPGRWLMLALGVALGVMVLVVSAGLRTEATVAAVRSAVDALPAPQRAVLAVTSRDLRGAALTAVDRSVRDGFGVAGLTSVQHTLTFRPLALAGTDVTLGATSDLPSAVRLSSGRLPRACRPNLCEVLAVTVPGSRTLLDVRTVSRGARSLGLVITGAGELTDRRAVGVRLVSADLPLLLGADPAALADLTSLGLFGRNTAWFGTLDGLAIASQGVFRFTRTLDDVAAAVNAASGPLSVSWPVTSVAGAGARADASADRLTLLGAGAGALQLGFCLLAAAGMRRRHQLTGQLLARRGGSPAQLLVIATVQAVLAVAAGVLIGLCAGAVVVGLHGQQVVPEPWVAAVGSARSSLPAVGALAAAAVIITVAVARWPAAAGRSTQLVVDTALVAVVGATVLLLVGASAGPQDGLAPSVVVLVATATGLIAARLWSPALALVLRLGRSSPLLHVGLGSARRRPLLARATTGFVAAACCSLVFAGAYRDSLLQAATDQSAAQVPLDVRVAPSAQVAVPLDVLDSSRLLAVSPEVAIHPVVSSPVTVFAGSSQAATLPLTGIDPGALAYVHEFAAVTGSDLTPTQLAARISVPPTVDQAAPVVPAGTRRLALTVGGMTRDITLSLWLSTPDGKEHHVPLTGAGPQLIADLTAVPGDAPRGPYSIRAMEIAESASHLVHRQHAIGEGATDRALAAGDLTLGAVTADGRPAGWAWTSWGSDQATMSDATPGSVGVKYQIGDARVVLTPGFAARTGLRPLPVAVDPDTAARAGPQGGFGITVNGITVPAVVAAVLPRMPTLGRVFVLADRAAVTALLDRTDPGTATVNQVWITAPGASLDAVRTVLESSSASAATLTYRADVAATLRADPVATRSVALLGIAGVIALVLAMAGVATAVRADLEESAADHFALELDGWTPKRLRTMVLLRWLSTLVVGVPLGVTGGFVLVATALPLLAPEQAVVGVVPPLRLMVATPLTAAVVGAAILGGLAACGLAVGLAFRESLPRPPDVDLR